MLKPDDLKNKTVSELRTQEIELDAEQFKIKLQHKMGQLEKPHRLQELRRDIARVKTMLGQKQE